MKERERTYETTKRMPFAYTSKICPPVQHTSTLAGMYRAYDNTGWPFPLDGDTHSIVFTDTLR